MEKEVIGKDRNAKISIGLVFKGSLNTLRKVEDLLFEEGAFLVYVEKTTKKLYIKKEIEAGEENDYRETE